jgi:hypothetical protein
MKSLVLIKNQYNVQRRVGNQVIKNTTLLSQPETRKISRPHQVDQAKSRLTVLKKIIKVNFQVVQSKA